MAKLDETLFTVMEVCMRFADCDVVLTHQKTMFLNKTRKDDGKEGKVGEEEKEGKEGAEGREGVKE